MKQPKISVIMLIHNRQEYIGCAIESILNQSFSDFEFLIIDNASADKSKEVARQYQRQDNRICILERSDGRIGAGRNLGLDCAQGEFFTFIDDDDCCEPDYLAFLLGLAECHSADIAVCGSFYESEGKRSPKYVFDKLVLCSREEGLSNFLLRRFFNSGNPTKLFRRTEQIRKIRYPEAGRYDDIHTMYRFFAAVGDQKSAVAAQGLPKYIVRRHTSNNSAAAVNHAALTPEWLEEYLAAYRERTQYISEKVPSLAALAQWSEWSFMVSMVEKINRYSLGSCAVQLAGMTDELRHVRDAFLRAPWTQEFERSWMEEYVK